MDLFLSFLPLILNYFNISDTFEYIYHCSTGLPVPFRQPLRMATGEIVLVKKNESPSDEEINEVMERVIKAVNDLYETKKPEWEKRPLKIT